MNPLKNQNAKDSEILVATLKLTLMVALILITIALLAWAFTTAPWPGE